MASTIQLKRGTGSAAPSSLAEGELALNIDNGRLFYGSGSAVLNSFRFTNFTASGDISSSGTIIADAIKATLSTGTSTNAVLLDSSNNLVIDAVRSEIFGANELLSVVSEGPAENLTVGFASVATQVKTQRDNTSSEFYPVIVDSNNSSATAENLKTSTTGLSFNPGAERLTVGSITNVSTSHVTASGNISGSSTTTITAQDLTLDRTLSAATVTATDVISGNISSSGHISASAGNDAGFLVRPNLYWFATNTSETVAANSNDGAFPSTDTTKIAWTEEVCSHQAIFVFASDTLTIKRAGLYKFTYNVTIGINNGSNRAEGGVALLKTPNGGSVAVVDGSVTSTYNRFVEGGGLASRGTACSTVVVNVAVDDVFQIDFAKICDTTDATKLKTLPEGTSWYVEALS